MSAALFEVFKALLTGGMAAAVFVVGQGVLRFVIEPAAELRKAIAEIGFLLIYQINVFHSPQHVPGDLLHKAQDEARRLAALLESRAQVVPFLGLWARTGWLPTRRGIREARGSLIYLSNSPRIEDQDDRAFVHDAVKKLRAHLKLPEME